MLDAVSAVGYRGLWIDRLGYPQGAEAIEAEVTDLTGEKPFQSPDGRFLFFDLRSYARAVEARLGRDGIDQAADRDATERRLSRRASGATVAVRQPAAGREHRRRATARSVGLREPDREIGASDRLGIARCSVRSSARAWRACARRRRGAPRRAATRGRCRASRGGRPDRPAIEQAHPRLEVDHVREGGVEATGRLERVRSTGTADGSPMRLVPARTVARITSAPVMTPAAPRQPRSR